MQMIQLKEALKMGLILLASILIGAVALWGVFCLPVEPMQKHMEENIEEFVREGENPFLLNGYKGSSLDNSTDALMLGNAVFKSELPAYKASMEMQHSENESLQHLEALQAYLSKGEVDILGSYARYWHGYLIVLKPLLLFFSYYQIRILNGVAAVVLFLLTVRKFYKRNMKKGIVALGLAVLSLFPITIPWSLQFSSVYYIGILACLVILYIYEVLEKNNYWIYFFLIAGICTSFMDFLTYPVFTFGMPLIVYVTIRKPDGKSGALFTLKSGICWSLGYVGMWAGKWTVGSLLTGRNVWNDAIGTIGTRMSSGVDNENVNRVLAVLRNFYLYYNVLGVLLAFIIMSWVGIQIWKYRENVDVGQFVLLIGIACLPIVWYLLVANHSYIHYWYTFRALAVSVFAVGMIPEFFGRRKKEIER